MARFELETITDIMRKWAITTFDEHGRNYGRAVADMTSTASQGSPR
jgi:hypothetical protein